MAREGLMQSGRHEPNNRVFHTVWQQYLTESPSRLLLLINNVASGIW